MPIFEGFLPSPWWELWSIISICMVLFNIVWVMSISPPSDISWYSCIFPSLGHNIFGHQVTRYFRHPGHDQ